MFTKFIIDFGINKFDDLSKSINLENIIGGRKGAVLVDCKNDLIPIVRTTTAYNKPVQRFLPIHCEIIKNIKKTHNLEFNNALIEIYGSSYRKMGYHSDQSLDLVNDSYICLFSHYNDPSTIGKRKLVIKEKVSGATSEIILDHNSAVLFSVSTNSKWMHKIILDKQTDNLWLGITFRLSKTFIKFVDGLQ